MASDGFPYPVDLPGNFSVADRPKPVNHRSDCAVHNEPALPAGPCDCGAVSREPDAMDDLLDRLDMAAVALDETAPHCAEYVREAMHALECSKAAHLMASIAEIIAIADVQGTACRGIAARLRALLADPLP